jgi:hypothetical protein
VLEVASGLHLHTADWDRIHWNLPVELWQVLWLQCLHSFSATCHMVPNGLQFPLQD